MKSWAVRVFIHHCKYDHALEKKAGEDKTSLMHSSQPSIGMVEEARLMQELLPARADRELTFTVP